MAIPFLIYFLVQDKNKVIQINFSEKNNKNFDNSFFKRVMKEDRSFLSLNENVIYDNFFISEHLSDNNKKIEIYNFNCFLNNLKVK